MEKRCKECGELFEPPRKDAVFCSKICKNRFNSKKRRIPGKKPQPCAWCGEMFLPKSKIHRFCSYECKKEHGNNKGKVNPEPKRCAICGEQFSPFSNANIYCSKACQKKAAAKKATKRNCEVPSYMRFSDFDFFPTKSGITGIETCSTIYNPMG